MQNGAMGILKRVSLYICVALVILCLVAVCGWCILANTLNSWSYSPPPSFHESWNEQQRADLAAMDDYLCNNQELTALSTMFTAGLSPVTLKLREYPICAPLALLLGRRDLGKPAREALHIVISTGKGDVELRSGVPIADLALRMHKIELVKELVNRGADPNHRYRSWMAPEQLADDDDCTLMVETLCDLTFFFPESPLPVEKRLELLDHMAAHGGTLSDISNPKLAFLYAAVNLSANENEESQLLRWALQHGLKLNDEDSIMYISRRYPALYQQLQQEGLLP